ncbi:MAG: peptidoglycan D,D-transpeptidase FtsI family protein [Nitrospiria bacterium]
MTQRQPTSDPLKPAPLLGVFCVMIGGFALILIRLVFIQGIEHDRWVKRANQAQEKNVRIEAERGAIYDRNGKALAMNLDRPSLYAIPPEIKDPVSVSKQLAAILNLPQKIILKRLRKKSDFAWIQRKITPEKMAKIDAAKIKGIRFIMESKRVYPRGPLMGQLIGFAGLDNQGLEGIEQRHDATLRGTEGAIILERDAYGKSVFPKDLQYIKPTPGKDLHLTLDERIQFISERELEHMLEKTGAKGGTAIVMDPWTGEILAMAIRPAFDPNTVRTSSPTQWRNRAIADFYEPGSTFKIVTAAAAIEERLITTDALIDCEDGAYRVKGGAIHDHDPFGVISFRQVIAHSSNIGTIKVAEILGEKRLSSYIQNFGFGTRLGIDLSGESPGLVRKTRQWSGRSLASISIGQEVGVTPLQMITATSALANGGYIMTPRIVKKIQGNNGETHTEPYIQRRVLTEKTTRTMTNILKTVVSNDGTARRAGVPGYTVAGKTGTAQKFDPETGRYSRDKYVSSFVGFAPADNPVVTILVMIDEPQGMAWGGEIAAPVFSNIANDVLYYLKVPPTQTTPTPQLPKQADAQPVKKLQIAHHGEAVLQEAYYEIGPSR